MCVSNTIVKDLITNMKLLTDHTCYMTYVVTFCEVLSSKDIIFIKCHISVCVTHIHMVFSIVDILKLMARLNDPFSTLCYFTDFPTNMTS